MNEGTYTIGPAQMSVEEMQAVVDFAKKNGLQSLSVHGIAFEFWDRPDLVARINEEQAEEKKTVPLEGDDMPSDEKMLFYSTDAFDEMEAEEEQSKQPEITP